jgi:acetyl-CoA acetyltransferase
MIASKWKMTREEINKFSGESHEKAAAAIKNGKTPSKYPLPTIQDTTKLKPSL